MREGIRGEQGEANMCVCVCGWVATCTHMRHMYYCTYNTTAGYLHTLIACSR